jgi:hypothetical protein
LLRSNALSCGGSSFDLLGKAGKAPGSALHERIGTFTTFGGAMDQTVALKHLGKIVEGGKRRLDRQRRIVANLERGGRDSRRSRELLQLFEGTLSMYLSHRDRLRNQLAL